MLKRNVLILLPLFLLVFSCITSNSSSGGSGVSVNSRIAPEWVNSADAVYPRTRYIAATGFADRRVMAEANALAALTAFFGQTVQVERTAASSYKQAIASGVVAGWIDTAEMNTNIKTSVSMDNLLGAEIKEVWLDPRGTYYAVAVMEKAKSAALYNELIRANLNIIHNLITMTPNEKNTLDGVIRYQFAAVVADVNTSYRNIVRLLDAPVPDGIASGDSYRLEARNIIRTIPISIKVTNDKSGRLFGAFAKCFTDLGFETNTGNSRYALDVNAVFSPVDLPTNPNKFVRIELAANLTDTNLGLVLLPYNFNAREGHITQSEAETRTVLVAERSINEEFAGLLSAYLSSLMPKK
jgi:hypothetical protein